MTMSYGPKATIEVNGRRATLDPSLMRVRKVFDWDECWICDDPLFASELREATRKALAGVAGGFVRDEVAQTARRVAELLGGRVVELIDCEVRPEDHEDGPPGVIWG